MSDQQTLLEIIEATRKRREERRAFMRFAGGATIAAGGAAMLTGCFDGDDDDDDDTPTPAPTPTPPPVTNITDNDILNFALNLEYLEANFYSLAAFGVGLPDNLTSGVGTRGAVTGGRKVTFTDPIVAEYAREIAVDEIAHVTFIRSQLGAAAISQPAINIDGGATGAFTAAARAAGVVTATATFDPYMSDETFLLASFVFVDVGVSAYKGGARLLTNPAVIEAAAGILAVEAYHAGLIRSTLYAKGVTRADLRDATVQISNARDMLDGGLELDQGIIGTATASNIVSADANAIAFGRTPEQVHNIAYLTRNAATSGGFFPAGTNNPNESLRRSGNNA